MPKIQRKTQKVFCNSADSDQLAVFGSMSTGTPVYSSDVEELQSNEAFDLGWDAATLEDKAPFMEEMNGVQYGLTYQIAYGLQEGIPEYDSATTYYIGSICKVLEDGKPVLYTSLTDDNIGNDPVNDSTNWERLSFGGGGLEIGDVGFTQMAIDESKGKRRVLNGQLIIQDQYVQFTNIIKATQALNPNLFCTEAEWQTELTMSANGVCDKYVIDDEAGTIRLPKYPEYLDLSINGAKTVSVYGDGKTLGLEHGSSRYGTICYGNSRIISISAGAYGNSNTGSYDPTTTSERYGLGVSREASKSGLTGSVTTSSEQIKGTYFIQVATGAETEDNIINEIELNNPFSLLDYKYSEYELNNLSWLRSEGQYNSKAIYPAVYDLLLKIYNGVETKAGVSVKLTTETFTDYDFVLNTADETFRLPVSVINSAQGYLYFYVGAVAQNAPIVNLGRIQETMVTRPMVDGQWVQTYLRLITSKTSVTNAKPLTFDLSNILPNDGYSYECIFDIIAETGTASGNSVEIMVSGGAIANGMRVCKAITRTNASVQTGGQFIEVIGTNRTIYFQEANGSQTSYILFFRLLACRRMGTNS